MCTRTQTDPRAHTHTGADPCAQLVTGTHFADLCSGAVTAQHPDGDAVVDPRADI